MGGLGRDLCGACCVLCDRVLLCGWLQGLCAEDCNDKFGFTREQQDEFALKSYAAAAAATEAGKFANEIVPVTVKTRKGEVQVSQDEEYARVMPEKVPTLRPAFRKDGSVTAANASSLNDGASAVVVMSAARAEELGVTPLARIRGSPIVHWLRCQYVV